MSTDTWYILEDGSAADPLEVVVDEKGLMRHKDGRPVAYAPHGPRSRSVDPEKERAKVDEAARAASAAKTAERAKVAEAAEAAERAKSAEQARAAEAVRQRTMQPVQPAQPYRTRTMKPD